MSLSKDGRTVRCDGGECTNAVPAPVALRRTVQTKIPPESDSITGWLFVTTQRGTRHYCPSCITSYLDDMNLMTANDSRDAPW
jgi:hypothetical protein